MHKKRSRLRALVLWTLLLSAAGTSYAEDVKGKWYIGGDLSILVATDDIRNNASLLIAPLGPDGAPFTGDKGEKVSCDPQAIDTYCDPRPDDLLSRETMLEQTLWLGATVGYGLTSHVSVQLDTGYYKGDVSNFDTFTTKIMPFTANPFDPCLTLGQSQPCDLKQSLSIDESTPLTAGSVTLIPVQINTIVRFRKDSNFNPYLGGGIGYVFSSISQDSSVDDLNAQLGELHILTVSDEFGPIFGRKIGASDPDGNAPFRNPASVSIDEGFTWQLVGGGEYFFNDRISLTFDAKYTIANQDITIDLNGEDQINVESWTEDLYRSDGSLRVFWGPFKPASAPNPRRTPPPGQPGLQRFTCDKNDDSLFDPPPEDYDRDGRADACYSGGAEPKQTTVVQGGSISMSAFSFGFGIRFHF